MNKFFKIEGSLNPAGLELLRQSEHGLEKNFQPHSISEGSEFTKNKECR